MELAAVLVVLFIGGAILVKARRVDNDDEDAGSGVAAWVIVLAILAIFGMT